MNRTQFLACAIVWLAFAAGLGLCLTGCGHQPEPRDVPSAVEEKALRESTPPAAAEVKDLDAQRRAAELAAAKAKAEGDEAEAMHQGILAGEIGRLQAKAVERQKSERADLDRLADAAHARAEAERAEAAKAAIAADHASDLRHAYVVGAIGAAVAVVLFIVCLKAALPLWLALVPGAASGAYVAFYAIAPAILASLEFAGRLVGIGLALAVVVGISIALRKLWVAARAGADHGDNLEASIVKAVAGMSTTAGRLTGEAHEEVKDVIAKAIAEVKGGSAYHQTETGIKGTVAAIRGKVA